MVREGIIGKLNITPELRTENEMSRIRRGPTVIRATFKSPFFKGNKGGTADR